MGMTNPFPEPDSAELERYSIYARVEIVALLRQLRDQKVLVTVYYDASSGFAVTNVLDVDPDFEEIILDFPSEEFAQQAVLASRRLVVVAFVDQIKLQFTANVAQATPFKNKPAFRMKLPQEMLRLQRRDYYRVQTPPQKPATCLVPWPDDAQKYESLKVMDISVGGLAVLAYPQNFSLASGSATIENCYLDLPGIGQVAVSLRIRHVEDEFRDENARRCGCEFVDMAPAAAMMLQRYVNKLDADSRKLAPQRAA